MIYSSCVFIFKIIHSGGGGGAKERVGPRVPNRSTLGRGGVGHMNWPSYHNIKTSLQPGIFSWPIVMAGNYVNKHGVFLEIKKNIFLFHSTVTSL